MAKVDGVTYQYSKAWFEENLPEYFAAGGVAVVEKPEWLKRREMGLPDFENQIRGDRK